MNSDHQSIGNGPIRLLFAVAGGAATAFALFWIMQALVSVTGELKNAGTTLTVDFDVARNFVIQGGQGQSAIRDVLFTPVLLELARGGP